MKYNNTHILKCIPKTEELKFTFCNVATIVSELWGFKNPSTTTTIIILATPHSMRDINSPTWIRTHTPCNGPSESQPVDHQGSPLNLLQKLF